MSGADNSMVDPKKADGEESTAGTEGVALVLAEPETKPTTTIPTITEKPDDPIAGNISKPPDNAGGF